MKLLTTAASFAPTVLAGVLLPREAPQEVEVVLQVSHANTEASIEVWSQDKSMILGQSCSPSLQSGLFAYDPIKFDVDDNGDGTFTVGPQSYTVNDCGRLASDDEYVVICHITFAAPPGLKPLEEHALADCFPKGPVDLL